MRIGLAANRLHHESADAALFRWLRVSETGIRELGVELHAVGRTYDAIASTHPLQDYPGLQRYPNGREGGLMKLVAEVVDDLNLESRPQEREASQFPRSSSTL